MNSIIKSVLRINQLARQTNSTRSLHLECKRPFRQSFFNRNYSTIGVITFDEVRDIPNHPEKLLIDVREPEEIQQTGQIPASINIPLSVLSQELSPEGNPRDFEKKYGCKKPLPSVEIIFYCKSGKRALKAAEKAVLYGYNNVKHYEGSWTDWAKRQGLTK